MKTPLSFKTPVAIAVMALSLFSPHLINTAKAQSCDPEYYTSLERRAWMEAQREISQNQNLITAGDSVLAYTCFNQFGNVLADDPAFSEADDWNSSPAGPINTDTDLDETLSEVVGDTLAEYINTAFPYEFRGGRSGITDNIQANIIGGEYNCDIMQQVWENAQCANFIERPEDGFHTFEWYQSNEPRQNPTPVCNGGNPDTRWTGGGGNGRSYPEEALGGGGERTCPTDGDLQDGDEFTPWCEDTDFVFFDVTDPCSDSPKIETGITVRQPNEDEYEEVICLLPGCTYSGGTGGDCE